MKLNFLLPDLSPREGGQACALALIAALRDAGHDVTCNAAPADGVLDVIDGYLLPRIAECAFERAVAIVHHPTALAAAAEREAIRAIERERLPRLSRVIATSEATASRLRDAFGVAAASLRVVTPGIAAFPRTNVRGEGRCRILSIGALVPRKGHDRLVEALARLPDLDWQLTIAGSEARDPAHAADLRARIEGERLAGRVRLAIDASDLETLWRDTDLYALFSAGETWPRTVAEALRRGIPVAATGCASIVPSEAGATGMPDDIAGMSKFLRRMICDGGLRRRMSDAAWRAGSALPGWATQADAFLRAIA